MTNSALQPARRPSLYSRIEADLLDRIARGVYPAGSTLPTERELCAEYGGSRITIRRAIDGLVQRRLVQRTPGRGTVICHADEVVKAITLIGYIDDVIPLNRHSVIDDRMVAPQPEIASLLLLGVGEPARCIRSVNHTGGLPLSYAQFYFPAATAPLIAPADFYTSVPPIRLIETRSGLPAASADQVVDPVAADAEVAQYLGIEPGTPVLRAVRGYFTADRRPLEAVFVHYHPQRYRYHVTLLPKVVPVRRSRAAAA